MAMPLPTPVTLHVISMAPGATGRSLRGFSLTWSYSTAIYPSSCAPVWMSHLSVYSFQLWIERGCCLSPHGWTQFRLFILNCSSLCAAADLYVFIAITLCLILNYATACNTVVLQGMPSSGRVHLINSF